MRKGRPVAMSQDNVEVVRRALEAHHSSNLEARIEALLDLWDPSCEYTSVMAALELATYHGHDGMRRYLGDLAARWAEWRTEPEEIFELDSETVFATIRFSAVGKDSGVPVEAQLASVLELRNRKLVRARTYPSREEALEAAARLRSDSSAEE